MTISALAFDSGSRPEAMPGLNPGLRLFATALKVFLSITLLSACSNSDTPETVGILEWDRIELTAESNDPIIEFHVEEGDRVQAGQPIARQDTQRVQARRDEAEAARQQAAARLAELKRGPRSERIDEAQAHLRGAESELQRAQAEFERISQLVERRLSTAEALDLARARHDRARADRDAARAGLQQLLAGTTVEELNQAEAALAQTEAQLRGFDVTLQRLTITAPRDGRIDVLPFELGERPQAGDVIAVLLAGQSPYARVYIPEPIRAHITQGTEAEIFVDGIAEPFAGHVRMISRDAVFTPFYSLTEKDRSRLSYLAEVELEGEQARQLSSGVPLRVRFAIEPKKDRK